MTGEVDGVWFDAKGRVSRHSDTRVEEEGLITVGDGLSTNPLSAKPKIRPGPLSNNW